MMKQILILLTSILCLSASNVSAGWHEVYNFKGHIDQYPISLSIQIRKGYFGEKGKENFNVIGVYKYDRYNEPIKLEGKLNFESQKVILYELSKNKYSAKFEFKFSKNVIKGTWKNLSTNKTRKLSLKFVSQLIDTMQSIQFNKIRILQADALPKYYFVGIYSKQTGERRTQMNKLKIIDKRSNEVFQTLDFSNIRTQTGNVMTIIYDNVEITNKKLKEFIVWNNIGRMGGYLTVKFDNQEQKFILNPKPTIDGPN